MSEVPSHFFKKLPGSTTIYVNPGAIEAIYTSRGGLQPGVEIRLTSGSLYTIGNMSLEEVVQYFSSKENQNG